MKLDVDPDIYNILKGSKATRLEITKQNKKPDKYKDPTNKRILSHISKEFRDVKRKKEMNEDQFKGFRIGAYMGMNATLIELGMEPL